MRKMIQGEHRYNVAADEIITNASFRLDVRRVGGIILNLRSQPSHMNINRSGFHKRVIFPYSLQELLAVIEAMYLQNKGLRPSKNDK